MTDDYDPRITKETWDLAELKWRAYAAGCQDVSKAHPELGYLRAECSFCQLFHPNACEPCPLLVGEGDWGRFGHCCGGTYAVWQDLIEENDEGAGTARKEAWAVLHFIRAQRVKWEQHLSRSQADCKED